MCLVEIRIDENHELFIRKCIKIDPLLGGYISKILKNEWKSSEEELLEEIASLKNTEKISISTEIKLNKFKYIIPEPHIRKTEPN